MEEEEECNYHIAEFLAILYISCQTHHVAKLLMEENCLYKELLIVGVYSSRYLAISS